MLGGAATARTPPWRRTSERELRREPQMEAIQNDRLEARGRCARSGRGRRDVHHQYGGGATNGA